MTTVCCICFKTKNNNAWQFQPNNRSIAPYDDELISHGYCPDCYKKQLKVFTHFHTRQLQPGKENQQ